MKFEWRKPDGTEVAISSPDEISHVLNSLEARHETAKSAGSKMEAAALEVQYEEQYKQWLMCMAFYYQHERKEVGLLLKRSRQTFAWWDQWSAQYGNDGEVSELQQALLKGLPKDLWPRSWVEAAKIINRNPDLRPPSTDLDTAKQCLADVIANASSCLELAEYLATNFYHGDRPEQNEVNAYQAERAKLAEALANAADL